MEEDTRAGEKTKFKSSIKTSRTHSEQFCCCCCCRIIKLVNVCSVRVEGTTYHTTRDDQKHNIFRSHFFRHGVRFSPGFRPKKCVRKSVLYDSVVRRQQCNEGHFASETVFFNSICRQPTYVGFTVHGFTPTKQDKHTYILLHVHAHTTCCDTHIRACVRFHKNETTPPTR